MHFTLITFFINSAERSRVLNQYVDMAIMLVVGVYCLLVFPQYWIVATEVLWRQCSSINIMCLRRNCGVKSPRKTRQGRHQVRCQASEDDKMGPTFSSWTRSHQLLDTGSSTNREHLQVNVWNMFIWSASYFQLGPFEPEFPVIVADAAWYKTANAAKMCSLSARQSSV